MSGDTWYFFNLEIFVCLISLATLPTKASSSVEWRLLTYRFIVIMLVVFDVTRTTHVFSGFKNIVLPPIYVGLWLIKHGVIHLLDW